MKLRAIQRSPGDGAADVAVQPLAAWQSDVVRRTVGVLQAVQPVIRGLRRACLVLAVVSAVGALSLGVSVGMAGSRHPASGVLLFLLCLIPAAILLWFRWGIGDVLRLADRLSHVPAAKDVAKQLDELRQSIQHRQVSVLGIVQAALNARRRLSEVENLKGVVTALNPWQILWTLLATVAAFAAVVLGVISVILLIVF